MTLCISIEEARNFLAAYHFTPTDVPAVFAQLGSVQYDPLNPVGRNPDLVFQARVPAYQVNDWQSHAYTDRIAYDAWDKQACLVPSRDWSNRALIRRDYQPWHDREILTEHPEMAEMALREIDARGPLSSLEFEDRSQKLDGHSWLGPTFIKRTLRALWVRGILVTHHRTGARHYYDRPERVIPPMYFDTPPLLDADAYHRWIVLRRHQATGLLRTTASAEVWSTCGDAATRARAIAQLVDQKQLVPVKVGSKQTLFHMPGDAISMLTSGVPSARMIYVAPLDNLIWDRKAIQYLFDFTYLWEVYKKAPDRLWGYYVLPIFLRDRFVGRLDSRHEVQTWTIHNWWWEEGVGRTIEMLEAVQAATGQFVRYLGAEDVKVSHQVDPVTRSAIHAWWRTT